jgi:hypothetical protein
MTRKVRLVGGRRNGDVVEVRYGQRLKVVETEDEEWVRTESEDLTVGWVPMRRLHLDTYRMTDDPYVFEIVNTPTAYEETIDLLEGDDW